MKVAERIQIIRLLEKKDTQPKYWDKLGLKDTSTFRGRRLEHEPKIRRYKR